MTYEVKVETWKIGQSRYLHQVEVPGGYFDVVSDSYYTFLSKYNIIFRNKVMSKKDTKETKGLKLVKGEHTDWLTKEDWIKLCFGGEDNLKLRKKIYGKELGEVKIRVLAYPRTRVIDWIKKEGTSENLLFGHSAFLRRNMQKRIKDPLPYLIFKSRVPERGEIPVVYVYTIPELSFILFNLRIKRERY